jgi:hypothetical protein
MHSTILDNIDAAMVHKDIHLYVQKSLDGNTWTPRRDWKPQPEDVDEIVSRAGALFSFAATAIRYVVAGSSKVSPQKAVNYLLTGAPLLHLHDLYLRIMTEAITVPSPGDDLAWDYYNSSMKVLGAIYHLYEPLDSQNLATLLGMEVKDLLTTLQPLTAVIHVPDKENGAIKIIHLSFKEFLKSKIQDTRPDLCCDTAQQRFSLVSAILCVMYRELQFNICQLPTSHIQNHEIDDLQDRLDRYIPHHLRYSCRFWINHLAVTPHTAELSSRVENLLCNKFLFWLEVMSLLGIVNNVTPALSELMGWTRKVDHFFPTPSGTYQTTGSKNYAFCHGCN